MRYCKSTIFQANHNTRRLRARNMPVVCDTAKVRFSKQITTKFGRSYKGISCLRYCKSTIFQANHNILLFLRKIGIVVCDTAKVRFSKQITTIFSSFCLCNLLFAILQKYDFPSKSQLKTRHMFSNCCCLRYCKSTIFQANHNCITSPPYQFTVVCDTAKVRFSKQITTVRYFHRERCRLFAILQKYDFPSKSQLRGLQGRHSFGCLRYCKSTIFQANHNADRFGYCHPKVVCDTAKVRFSKQITTVIVQVQPAFVLFAILQKYDFPSKSQRGFENPDSNNGCLRYCKSTIFQANHNYFLYKVSIVCVVCDTAKVRFSKQITT